MRDRFARILPRGPKDFAFQLALWFGFGFAYQVARGIADHEPLRSFLDGVLLIKIERALHLLVEPDLQRVVVHTGGVLLLAVNWTYWLSQFVVLALALLWIYLHRNDVFIRARNWIFATNLLALVGYIAMPSIHAADALIIGFFMASLVRHRWAKLAWTLWPSWVWFSVMATGNHYWLDVAAGVGVAMLAGTWLAWFETRSSQVPAAITPTRRW